MAYEPQAGQSPAGAPAQGTSGKAIASLVLGILGLLLAGLLGLILAIIALFLGFGARKDIEARPGLGGNGMAVAGIVLGIIALILSIIFIIAVGIVYF